MAMSKRLEITVAKLAIMSHKMTRSSCKGDILLESIKTVPSHNVMRIQMGNAIQQRLPGHD
eukprot:11628228-Ditylum_brightwellii.AAC.1